MTKNDPSSSAPIERIVNPGFLYVFIIYIPLGLVRHLVKVAIKLNFDFANEIICKGQQLDQSVNPISIFYLILQNLAKLMMILPQQSSHSTKTKQLKPQIICISAYCSLKVSSLEPEFGNHNVRIVGTKRAKQFYWSAT